MNGRAISLFLLAEPVWGDDTTPVRVGSMDFRVFQRRGLDLVGWSHAPLSYLLVSEDGLDDRRRVRGLPRRRHPAAIAEFVAAVAGRPSGT